MATLNYHYDAQAILEDGAGANTATGAGSNSGHFIGTAEVKAGTLVLVDISALDTANADETYTLAVQVSNDDFTTTVEACSRTMTGTGQFKLPFTNWVNGTVYKEVRVHHTLGGTTPSITYTARLTGF